MYKNKFMDFFYLNLNIDIKIMYKAENYGVLYIYIYIYIYMRVGIVPKCHTYFTFMCTSKFLKWVTVSEFIFIE